jgi:hypothetical protein
MARCVSIGLVLVVAFAVPALAERKYEKLKLEDLPPAVRESALSQAPDFRWHAVRIQDADAQTKDWYELHGEKTQDPAIYHTPEGVDMVILPDGYIQEHKVAGKTENVPQIVRETLKQQRPGWYISSVDEIRVGGKKEVALYRLFIADEADLEGDSATTVEISFDGKTFRRFMRR